MVVALETIIVSASQANFLCVRSLSGYVVHYREEDTFNAEGQSNDIITGASRVSFSVVVRIPGRLFVCAVSQNDSLCDNIISSDANTTKDGNLCMFKTEQNTPVAVLCMLFQRFCCIRRKNICDMVQITRVCVT